MISVKRRDLAAGAWDDYVDMHDDGWWWHRSEFLDYALAYTPGATDQSIALMDDSGIAGIMPAVALDGKPASYGGRPLACPLVDVAVGSLHCCAETEWRPGQAPEGVVPMRGFRLVTRQTHVLEVQQPAEMLRGVRKSYRSLIRSAERRFDISAHSRVADARAAMALMRQARDLHIEVAGRATRPEETWFDQCAWLVSGNGLLAGAWLAGRLRGFAYAVRYKDFAYYFSSACAEPNLAHALVWRLATTLALDGETRRFELGLSSGPDADEKARGISFFKSGFGGELWDVAMVVRA